MQYHSSTDRAEVRNVLLKNGHKPLPLADKGVYIEGWSRVDITPEWLDTHRRTGRYANTGLRCDDLIAFDIDVLDEDLADQCEQFIEARAGETDFCRIGQWPKRLLVYRGQGARSGRTARYEGGHMVELLCGPGRQFAAYGTHPRTGDYYKWEGLHPAIAKLDKIPGLTYDAAQEILNELDTLLASTGLSVERRAHMRGGVGKDEYDMLPDTVVEYEGQRITWGELTPQLTTEGGFGNLYRPEYDDWGDSSAIHFYLAFGSKEPAAHDFVNDCTHWSAMPYDQFAQLLPPMPVVAKDQFTPDEIDELYSDCVITAEGAGGSVRFLHDPTRICSLSSFRQTIKHLRQPAPTRQNPNRTVEVFVGWLEDRKSLRARYPQFRPDKAPGIFSKGGLHVLNTYRPPSHGDWLDGGTTDVFYEFLQHLIPNHDELMLFEGWLAHKVQFPHHRMHGMMMVTPEYGTGRGTLCQIMSKLFGNAYVNEIELGDIIGTSGSQSNFNQYMAESLIVTVSEALEEREDTSRWQSRHVAYERLKRIVDTTAGSMHIKRKYGMNTTEQVFASLFIMSNHADALAIPPGDRRMIVIENCETRLENAPRQLHERINEWMASDANISALHAELLVPAQSYDAFGTPPMTHAKERMVEAAQSDMDKLWELFVDQAQGDICTMAQWRRFANQNAMRYELSLPTTPEKRDSGLVKLLQSKCRRCDELPKSGLKVKGNVVRPWIIRNFAHWRGSADRAAMREQILRNGDPGGAVVHLPDID